MTDEKVQPREEQSFRLTGEVDGSRLTYDLTTGEHTIGASEDSEVQMAATGVSRRHAALTIGNGTLTVRDLDSKNGTFVNGRKIEERTVDEGDWIGFGPIVLYVVRVHPDDAKVAIPLNPSRRWKEHIDSTTEVRSISRRSEDEPARWIELLNRMTDELVGPVEPSLGDALDTLREGLGAAGKAGRYPRLCRALHAALRRGDRQTRSRYDRQSTQRLGGCGLAGQRPRARTRGSAAGLSLSRE
jgi:pSer/pThr/pTyr-binding forkhead associated (FHA) protein